MKFLVLGSEGVIGNAFCLEAEKQNHVCVRWDIKLDPIFNLRQESNMPALQKAVDECDFVLFAAYDVGGAKFLTSMNDSTISNNTKIMYNTFQCLKNRKFIFCSSTMSHISTNSYGVSKRLGEIWTADLGGISVRLWNVYGFEDVSLRSHVICDFVHNAFFQNKIEMRTTGEEKRQMLESSDCARAFLAIFEHYEEFSSKKEAIDISNGEWITIYEIALMVQKILPQTTVTRGKAPDTCHITYMEPQLDQIRKYWAPKITLEQGIRFYVEQLSKKKEQRQLPPLETSFSLQDILDTTLNGKGDSDKHLMTLFSMVIQTGSKKILELGVRSGSTTLPLLKAASLTGGSVISVDLNPTNFQCPDEYKDRWTFVQSDALKFLEKYSNMDSPWDFVFIDDWHSYDHVKKELEMLDFQISPSTVILLHDLMYADYQPHYHSDIAVREGQWANGGPYRAVAELNPNFWEFSTIPVNNGLTLLRKKYSGLKFKR